MTKIPDAQTLLVECLGALNWVPNRELPEGSNYGDTYALAAHVAARLNIMRDAQTRKASDEKLSRSTGRAEAEPDPEVEAEKEHDRDFAAAHALLAHVVGQGYRVFNDDVAISRDLWNRIEAWVKKHEPKPKPKLKAEDVLREVYEQAYRSDTKVGLPAGAWDLVAEWMRQDLEKQHGPTCLVVLPRYD